jgi:hypothetical protein
VWARERHSLTSPYLITPSSVTSRSCRLQVQPAFILYVPGPLLNADQASVLCLCELAPCTISTLQVTLCVRDCLTSNRRRCKLLTIPTCLQHAVPAHVHQPDVQAIAACEPLSDHLSVWWFLCGLCPAFLQMYGPALEQAGDKSVTQNSLCYVNRCLLTFLLGPRVFSSV